jgi:asparagine synthase (glutamine-hydrolysing)
LALLSDALKKNFVSFQWDPVTASRTYHTLINENAARELQALRRQPLPWVRKGIHVPPGKQFHVFSMMSPGGYYSAFERTHEPAYIVPLMSQPIVELCLRIPTYVLASNGWDREIARSAFVDDVPAEILRRRSKGGQEQYTNDLFRKNRDFIRELLLNGGLVREGLLDKAKVEQALTGRPSNILAGTGKLSQYISVEAWLKICAAHRVRSAA